MAIYTGLHPVQGSMLFETSDRAYCAATSVRVTKWFPWAVLVFEIPPDRCESSWTVHWDGERARSDLIPAHDLCQHGASAQFYRNEKGAWWTP